MRRLVLLVACVACVACSRETRVPSTNERAGGAPSATFAEYDAGAVAGGPGRGARYAFGRPASDSLIRALDSDVGPSGAELPPGRGTAAEGARLYAAQCASCHGTRGEGIAPNPSLVSEERSAGTFDFGDNPSAVKTIGSYWPYATTVFDYIKRAMPLNAPGSLSDPDVYALTAWLLAANGVLPQDATLDADALRKVQMPARSRFVADDRVGGAEVR